jgi:hypothetical protein
MIFLLHFFEVHFELGIALSHLVILGLEGEDLALESVAGAFILRLFLRQLPVQDYYLLDGLLQFLSLINECLAPLR